MIVRIKLTLPKAAFRYPSDPGPRTAVLKPWFRQRPGGATRVFPGGWCREAAEFAPAALAGTADQLLALAGQRVSLTHALIVLRRPADAPLSMADRERLWRAFRVPVFEQVVGYRGKLLAAECEAHDGLHMEAPVILAPGYRLETAVCACGRKTPRLSPAELAAPAPAATATGPATATGAATLSA